LKSARLLRASVALNVVLVLVGLFAAARRLAGRRDEGARLYAEERASIFAALPRRAGGTVLLGDSLTDRGEWAELLDDPAVRNRGVAGDTTADVLRRAGAIAALKPDRVVVQVGVNDLAAGEPFGVIVERYGAILDALRAGAPDARLFCQSLLPVIEGRAPPLVTNAKVRALSDLLARAAAERRCRWIDVGPALADGGGSLAPRFTLDGLHLTGEGYAVWAGVLAPALRGAAAAP
jgi:lysophospholipase L1-like esterase